MLHPELTLESISNKVAFLVKKDKNKPWPDNNCSNERLLSYINKPEATVEKVRFIDVNGVGDGVKIFFS